MARTARRLCGEGIEVATPDHEGVPDSLGRKLSRRDELPYAVRRYPEKFGCGGGAYEVVSLRHRRASRAEPTERTGRGGREPSPNACCFPCPEHRAIAIEEAITADETLRDRIFDQIERSKR